MERLEFMKRVENKKKNDKKTESFGVSSKLTWDGRDPEVHLYPLFSFMAE